MTYFQHRDYTLEERWQCGYLLCAIPRYIVTLQAQQLEATHIALDFNSVRYNLLELVIGFSEPEVTYVWQPILAHDCISSCEWLCLQLANIDRNVTCKFVAVVR